MLRALYLTCALLVLTAAEKTAPSAVKAGAVSNKAAAVTGKAAPEPDSLAGDLELPVVLPEHPTDDKDAYLCTSVQLPDRPLKLVGIASTSDQRIVHHMLLFGCKYPAQTGSVWNCRMRSACADSGSENVLYGWGKNAPPMSLPQGAGFSVGPGTSIRTVVLQVHYLDGRPANDTSGVKLTLSPAETPNSAGMVAFAASFSIPPRRPKTLVQNACCYNGWEPLHGFATRVHTHALGREVYLDRWRPDGSAEPDRIISLDPQDPQACQYTIAAASWAAVAWAACAVVGFYPIKPEAVILPGDRLAMACHFNSSEVGHVVVSGAAHSDEMCNLYLMLYGQLPIFMWCMDGSEWVELGGAGGMSDESQLVPEALVWKPPAAVPGAAAAGKATATRKAAGGKQSAGSVDYPVGQVPGVATASDGTVWVFHRGDRAWQTDGSISSGGEEGDAEAVLQGPTVMQIDQDTGKELRSWGAGQFVLPHMITVDWAGDIWVTDVALHQAIKFSPEGKQLMALGERMQSGSDSSHFCQPTQVAVARSGSVFVADGYCNSRVAEFDANGTWQRDYMLPMRGEVQMQVPHSVVVQECRKQLLVADREAGRVHAFQLGTAKYHGHWDFKKQYGLPYALALGPYGSVLALTWTRDSQAPKTFVVALDADPGFVGSAWEVPGVVVPHDLALAPAPLQLTGAGERLLALVVSETKESVGDNLHKFVFMLPDVAPASGSSGRDIAQHEQQQQEQQQDEGRDHDSQGGHLGHDAGSGGEADAVRKGKPAGMAASHIGHVMLKPVGGGSGNGSSSSSSAAEEQEQQQQQEIGQHQHQQEPGQQQQEQQLPAKPGGAAAAAAQEKAPRGGRAMIKPVDESTEQEAGEEDAAVAGPQAEPASVHAEEEAAKTAKQQSQQQQELQQTAGRGSSDAKPQAAAAAAAAAQKEVGWQADEAAANDEKEALPARDEEEGEEGKEEEEEADSLQPSHDSHAALRHSFAPPLLVGLVFLPVALLSWNRLQHWRGHSGVGYLPPGHRHAV
ncbi:Peptidyl-glycine alpha-amidating monooxygenase A [Chlorella vulgaris]